MLWFLNKAKFLALFLGCSHSVIVAKPWLRVLLNLSAPLQEGCFVQPEALDRGLICQSCSCKSHFIDVNDDAAFSFSLFLLDQGVLLRENVS